MSDGRLRILSALAAWRHRRQLRAVDYRGLVDPRYLERLTGVRLPGDQAAARAYLGRPISDPPASLFFDHHQYLSENPDVFASELHPLTHYVLQGRAEGRYPFDPYRVAVQPQLRYTSAAPVAVCVPVFGARDEAMRCLSSVLEARGYDRLIVCDDGTDDETLRDQLLAWRDEGRIELVDHGGPNLGFTRSANLLMEVAAGCDVILLNSDTEVFGRWIDGLRGAAYAGTRVASVTALSNNASIASWPLWPQGGPMSSVDFRRIAGALASSPPEAYPLLPTCVGFCVYLRRDAIADIGAFDEVAFPRGYGEENDWSLRAQQAGWVHLLAPHVYVRHDGNRSFLDSKASNSLHGSQELRRRYPHYESGIARWSAAAPLTAHLPRTATLFPAFTPNDVQEIHLTHGYGGGTDTAIATLVEARPGSHLVIRLGPGQVRVSVLAAAAVVEVDHELLLDEFGPDELGDILAGSPDADIWIHDVHGVPPWVVTLLLNLPRPWRVFIHDMGAICSRRFMVLPSGLGCLGPQPDRCTRCVSLDPSPHAGPSNWRHLLSSTVLQDAAEVVAPSHFAAKQVSDASGIPVEVLPLDVGRRIGSVSPQVVHSPSPSSMRTQRVAVIGTMVPHKGSRQLAGLVEWCFVHSPDLVLKLIGEWKDPAIPAPWPLAVTGAYEGRQALGNHLSAFEPHVVLFVSPAAETYSLTFDEARNYAALHNVRLVVPAESVFADRGGADVETFDRSVSPQALATVVRGKIL